MVTRKRQTPSSDDEAPSCWICLDEGQDESGQPLVRDCSCRGNSGFVHLSCIANYAESICTAARNSGKFIAAWTICHGCRQSYENKMACDLAVKCKSFVETNHPKDLWYRSHAAYIKLRTIAIDPCNKEDALKTANEVISIVGKIKAKKVGDFMPREFLYFEVTAYESLALFAEAEVTKDSLREAVEYHTKCRDVYALIGIETDVAHAEANIARVKSKYNGDKDWTVQHSLKDCQDYFDESVAESGEESSVTMISLLRLAEAMKSANHGIESERTLAKLSAIANRVHGESHYFAAEVEATLRRYKRRYVFIRGERGKRFQALRHMVGENKYVVQGPIARPRSIEEEKTFIVHNDEIRPALGTLVICHGLKDSDSHNGKIGDLRSREKGTQNYEVHFEDKSLQPCLVSKRNARILFELPSEG